MKFFIASVPDESLTFVWTLYTPDFVGFHTRVEVVPYDVSVIQEVAVECLQRNVY